MSLRIPALAIHALASACLLGAGYARAQELPPPGNPYNVEYVDMRSATPAKVEEILRASQASQEVDQNASPTPERANTRAIVELPRASVTPQVIRQLQGSGIRVEPSAQSNTLNIEVGTVGSISTDPRFAQLLGGANLTSFSYKKFKDAFDNSFVQQVVGPQVPDELRKEIKPEEFGKFSITGGVVGTPECRDSADKSALVQDFADLFEEANLETKVDALRFIDACLAPVVQLDATPPPAFPSFVPTPAILEVMGLLELQGADGTEPVAICTAFLIDNRRIATARHCLYYAEFGGRAIVERKLALEFGWLGFRRLNFPFDLVPVTRESPLKPGFDPLKGRGPDVRIAATADILVLDLAAPVENLPQLVFQENLDVRHAAWIAGPLRVTSTEAPGANPLPKSVRSVRWTRGAECSIYPKKNGCLAHVCQTVGSFSGAPIVVASADPAKVVIGGIHLGTYESLGDSCPALPSSYLLDGGYTVDRGANGGVGARVLVEHIAALE